MDENQFLQSYEGKIMAKKLTDTIQYTKQFGLSLSEKDAKYLLDCRKNSLKEQERMELDEPILLKLIYTFCDSPFIYQANYAETMEALQNIFYQSKNETLDMASDDELLSFMKEHFDGNCQGSLEFLEETCLEEWQRGIRGGLSGDDLDE